MDAKLNDSELEARIRADKLEQGYYATAKAATEEMDKRGCTMFTYHPVRGSSSPVGKEVAEWRVDGRSLASVQEGIDLASVRAIERRAELRAAKDYDARTDRLLVHADGFSFRHIQNQDQRERAAITMSENARQYPAYKKEMDTWSMANVAKEVYALDAEHDRMIAEKEERKTADAAVMVEDRRARAAAWSPKEAAKQAKEDAGALSQEKNKSEQHYMLDDMALKVNANPHYRAALSPNIIGQVEDHIESKARYAFCIKHLEENHRALDADPRFAQHTDAELAKAAFYRGVCAWKQADKQMTDMSAIDASVANLETLRRLPNIQGVILLERQHARQDHKSAQEMEL